MDRDYHLKIEDKLHMALSVPGPDPVFVSSLRARLHKVEVDRKTNQASPLNRLRLAWSLPAIILTIAMIITLAIGPQKVWAAVRSLFGIIPGFGVVEPGTPIRGVGTPVTQIRTGITITIDQGIATNEWTVIQFTVEGLTSMDKVDQETPGCMGSASIVLPDNSALTQGAVEGRGWASGYQVRSTFGPIPANVDHFSLLIPCLQGTIPGTAPENWVFDLTLGPAPVDIKTIPFIDGSTPSAESSQTQRSPTPSLETIPLGIQMILIQAADVSSGYRLKGYISWNDPEVWLNAGGPYDMAITDANGERLPLEPYADLSTESYDPAHMYPFTLQTQGKGNGALTLTLERVSVNKMLDIPFEVDLGNNIREGRTWPLNQEFDFQGDKVRIVSVTAQTVGSEPALQFTIETTGKISTARVADPVETTDPNQASVPLGGGGGGGRGGDLTGVHTTTQSIIYDQQLPQGMHTFKVSGVSYDVEGPWQVTWEPLTDGQPAAENSSQNAAACLNDNNIGQSTSGLPALISGRVLLEVPSTGGQRFPSLVMMDLTSNQRMDIGIGRWSSFSPDGSKVFYSDEKGMHIVDLATRNDALLSWVDELDHRPLLSPDGEWLAFVRRNEGVFMARLDGSNLHKIPDTSADNVPIGWLPDGRRILMVTILGQWGSQMHSVDFNTGESRNYFMIEIHKGGTYSASSYASRVAFVELPFGKQSYGVYTSNLNGTGKKLVAGLTNEALVGSWSPDGKWVNITTADSSGGEPKYTSYLVQPDICQVYVVPDWGGVVAGWVK